MGLLGATLPAPLSVPLAEEGKRDDVHKTFSGIKGNAPGALQAWKSALKAEEVLLVNI